MSTDETRHDLSALADTYQDEAGTQRGLRQLRENLRRLHDDPREQQRIDDIADLTEAGRDAFRLGQLAEQRGDLEEAEHCYRRAAAIGHDDAAGELARVLHATSKHDEADLWRQRAQELGLTPATPQTGSSAAYTADAGGRGGTTAPGSREEPGEPVMVPQTEAHDRVALDEIELYAEVLSAAAAANKPLTAEQLDEVLGVRHAPDPDHALTRRQRMILQIIEEWQERTGYPPTLREIAEAAGLTSTSAVAYQLSTLANKGYLRPGKERAHTVEADLPSPK